MYCGGMEIEASSGDLMNFACKLLAENFELRKALAVVAEFEAGDCVLEPEEWSQFGESSMAETIVYYVETARTALEVR